MLRAMLLSRPKPPQAGAGVQLSQGHSSQRQLSTKVSGPPLAAASTAARRPESTASACEIHPLKIQKSRISGVCIKLNLVCPLYNAKIPYPALFPPPGLLSFAFDDADQT